MAHGVEGNGEASPTGHDLGLAVGAAAVADATGKAPLHKFGRDAHSQVAKHLIGHGFFSMNITTKHEHLHGQTSNFVAFRQHAEVQ